MKGRSSWPRARMAVGPDGLRDCFSAQSQSLASSVELQAANCQLRRRRGAALVQRESEQLGGSTVTCPTLALRLPPSLQYSPTALQPYSYREALRSKVGTMSARKRTRLRSEQPTLAPSIDHLVRRLERDQLETWSVPVTLSLGSMD